MIQNNDELNTLNEQENTGATGNVEDIKDNITNDTGNTTFTDEEIEQANKPQPNVITSATSVSDTRGGITRDNMRVADRPNEAPDLTDTNTGGIIAGGAKGASQS